MGHTDLNVTAKGTLTTVRYWDEILRVIIRLHPGEMGPGFPLVQVSAQTHVVKVCRQLLDDKSIDASDRSSCSPGLNPIEHLWGIIY